MQYDEEEYPAEAEEAEEAPSGVDASGADERPIEVQCEDFKAKVKELMAELHTAKNDVKAYKHEAEVYKRRLKVSRQDGRVQSASRVQGRWDRPWG